MKVEIFYDAKCKDCAFLGKGNLIKDDGTESKKVIHFCDNKNSKPYHQAVTLKTKACESFALMGTL